MGMFGSSANYNQQPTMYMPEEPKPERDVFAPSGTGHGGGFFAPGGAGRGIAGYIGDALLGASGRQPIYAPAMQQQHEAAARLQQAMMLARFKAQNPEPTTIQRNTDYFRSIGRPELSESYLRAQANPMALMTDPATGAVGFYPKGGIAPAAAPTGPVSKVLNGKTYWNINGEWYDNPEGR